MRVVGRRFNLPNRVTVEIFDSGAICLRRDNALEYYDNQGRLNSTTDTYADLSSDLSCGELLDGDLRKHVLTFGRPYGMIWSTI